MKLKTVDLPSSLHTFPMTLPIKMSKKFGSKTKNQMDGSHNDQDSSNSIYKCNNYKETFHLKLFIQWTFRSGL